MQQAITQATDWMRTQSIHILRSDPACMDQFPYSLFMVIIDNATIQRMGDGTVQRKKEMKHALVGDATPKRGALMLCQLVRQQSKENSYNQLLQVLKPYIIFIRNNECMYIENNSLHACIGQI